MLCRFRPARRKWRFRDRTNLQRSGSSSQVATILLPGGRGVVLDELKHFKWMLPRSSVGLRAWLERVFERPALPPPQVQVQVEVQVEISSLPLRPKLIARTELLSFTSRQNLTRTNGGENLVELPFPEFTWKRHLGIFTRKGDYIPTASQVLVERIVQATSEIE